MEIVFHAFSVFTDPVLILLTAAGVLAGVYVGALPGLSGTMAVSLLVSFTYSWQIESALAVMVGVYVGAVFGGSRSAILLNIPGAPAAVATSLDGYPLARKGRAGEAMGLAATQSVVGTLLGAIALALFAPPISRLALHFHSVDYLLLALIGLVTVGSLAGGSLSGGLLSGALGVFLGCIGIDSQTAVRRFTFDLVYLNSGVHYVVAMIGLFGFSEVLFENSRTGVRQSVEKILPSWGETLHYLPLALRSAVIGVLVGALPGAGGDVAALLSYDNARRTVKEPTAAFGEGALEGVIAPECANNAAIGGAFIPMLTLGIPGDAVTAVLIGALMIQGIRPGPGLIASRPDIFSLIIGCLLLSTVFLLLFGLTGIRIFLRFVEIPRELLLPIVAVMSVIGSYALRGSRLDVLWMLLFGAVGYLMKRSGCSCAPVVLGIILQPLLEDNFRRGILLEGSIWGLIISIFRSPISVVLLLLLFLLTLSQLLTNKQKGKAS